MDGDDGIPFNYFSSVKSFGKKELIFVAKELKLSPSGNKKHLIDRIENYFDNDSWLAEFEMDFLNSKIPGLAERLDNILDLRYYWWRRFRITETHDSICVYLQRQDSLPHPYDEMILGKFLEEYCDSQIPSDLIEEQLQNFRFEFIHIPVNLPDSGGEDRSFRFESVELTPHDKFQVRKKLGKTQSDDLDLIPRKSWVHLAMELVRKGWEDESIISHTCSGWDGLEFNREEFEWLVDYELARGVIADHDYFFSSWTMKDTRVKLLINETIALASNLSYVIFECALHGKFVTSYLGMHNSREFICQGCSKQNGKPHVGFDMTGQSVFYVLKYKNRKKNRINAGISNVKNYSGRLSRHRSTGEGELTIIEELRGHSSNIFFLEWQLKVELLGNAGALERYPSNPLDHAREIGLIDQDGKITLFPDLDK